MGFGSPFLRYEKGIRKSYTTRTGYFVNPIKDWILPSTGFRVLKLNTKFIGKSTTSSTNNINPFMIQVSTTHTTHNRHIVMHAVNINESSILIDITFVGVVYQTKE